MKKFSGIVLLVFTLFLTVAAENSNLVQNPDFAQTYANGAKASYWGVNAKKDTGVFKPGANGGVLELKSNNKHTALLQEIKFSCDKETAVTFSFQFKGTVKNVVGTLHAIGADGKELKIKGRNAKVTATGEFKTASVKLLLPAGTRQLRVALRCYGGGTVTFKAVSLKK